MAKAFLTRTAQSLSAALHPVLVPFFVLYFMVPMDRHTGLRIWAVALALIVVYPLGASFVYFHRQGIRNFFVIERKYRKVPFLLYLSGMASFWLLTRYFGDFTLPDNYFILLSIVAGVAFGITLFWKISIHLMGIGGLTGLMLVLGPEPVWLLPALFGGLGLLLGWARYYLKAHDLAQLLAGFAVGCGVAAVVAMALG